MTFQMAACGVSWLVFLFNWNSWWIYKGEAQSFQKPGGIQLVQEVCKSCVRLGVSSLPCRAFLVCGIRLLKEGLYQYSQESFFIVKLKLSFNMLISYLYTDWASSNPEHTSCTTKVRQGNYCHTVLNQLCRVLLLLTEQNHWPHLLTSKHFLPLFTKRTHLLLLVDQTVQLLGSTSHVWGSEMNLRETGFVIN